MSYATLRFCALLSARAGLDNTGSYNQAQVLPCISGCCFALKGCNSRTPWNLLRLLGPRKKKEEKKLSCPRLAQDPAEKDTTLKFAIHELEPHCALVRPKHLISWHGSAFNAGCVTLLREFNDDNRVELPKGQTSQPWECRRTTPPGQ